jgi:hypothetical protein
MEQVFLELTALLREAGEVDDAPEEHQDQPEARIDERDASITEEEEEEYRSNVKKNIMKHLIYIMVAGYGLHVGWNLCDSGNQGPMSSSMRQNCIIKGLITTISYMES